MSGQRRRHGWGRRGENGGGMTTQDDAADFAVLPLGGAGEIGMNLYLYGWGRGLERKWLMVDCGVMFGDATTPGVDIILPDIGFIEERRKDLAAILITHAHEDHIGAVPWLAQRLGVPVYGTKFALLLIRQKLEELGLEEEVKLKEIRPGRRYRFDEVTVEWIPVTHSLPEPNALAFFTPAGTVIHTGDFKIDRSPTIPPEFSFDRFRALGDAGVEALICDSTNAIRPGRSPSEKEVAAQLHRLIAQAPFRVAVTTFSSHVARIRAVAEAAEAAGREVVVAGFAMRRVIEAAREVGLLQPRHRFLDEEAFGYIPREKIVLLCSGSQGEPNAALSRIARDSHRNIALEEGDQVIFSSLTIPGNEKAVFAVVNRLAMLGVDVIMNTPEQLVHTSGHPRQEELKELYDLVRPRRLVPMHGEFLHMRAQQKLAQEHGIAETALLADGELLRIAPGPAQVLAEIGSGQWHVDGKLLTPGEDGPTKQRRKLAYVGMVALSVALDHRGNVRGAVQLVADGLPEFTEHGELMEDVLIDAADAALDGMGRARRRNDEVVIDTLRLAVRRAARAEWGKKPVVHVLVQRV